MTISGGGGLGVEPKKIFGLAIARHDPPPLEHTSNFYQGWSMDIEKGRGALRLWQQMNLKIASLIIMQNLVGVCVCVCVCVCAIRMGLA